MILGYTIRYDHNCVAEKFLQSKESDDENFDINGDEDNEEE